MILVKKRISLILVTICFITLFSPHTLALEDRTIIINNHNISISQKEYSNLQSLGYSDYQIKNMNEDEFELNKNLSAVKIAESSKYIKVVEYYDTEEFNNYYGDNAEKSRTVSITIPIPIYIEEVELTKEQYLIESAIKSEPQVVQFPKATRSDRIANATATSSYKVMHTGILKLGTGQYRVRNDLIWTQMPVNRGEDLLKTQVSKNVIPNDDTRYGKQMWTLCNGNDCIEDEQIYTSTSSKWVTGGLYDRTLQQNLKDDEWIGLKYYNVTFLQVYMWYDLTKNYSGTINVLDAYGEYKHLRTDGYDSMPQTHAQATGVNW